MLGKPAPTTRRTANPNSESSYQLVVQDVLQGVKKEHLFSKQIPSQKATEKQHYVDEAFPHRCKK